MWSADVCWTLGYDNIVSLILLPFDYLQCITTLIIAYETRLSPDCTQRCQKINCSAIQYRNGMCSVHYDNFTMKMATDKSSVSFVLPGKY
jgi:hypothetical protein